MREATEAVADHLAVNWRRLSADPQRTAVEAMTIVNDWLVLPLHKSLADTDDRVRTLRELVHGDSGILQAVLDVLREIEEGAAHTCDGGIGWDACGPCLAAFGYKRIDEVRDAIG